MSKLRIDAFLMICPLPPPPSWTCEKGGGNLSRLKVSIHARFQLDIVADLMEQHVFGILNDYRGRHRKGIATYNAT